MLSLPCIACHSLQCCCHLLCSLFSRKELIVGAEKRRNSDPDKSLLNCGPLICEGVEETSQHAFFLCFFEVSFEITHVPTKPSKAGISLSKVSRFQAPRGSLKGKNEIERCIRQRLKQSGCTQNIYHKRKEMHEHLFMCSEIYFRFAFICPNGQRYQQKRSAPLFLRYPCDPSIELGFPKIRYKNKTHFRQTRTHRIVRMYLKYITYALRVSNVIDVIDDFKDVQ